MTAPAELTISYAQLCVEIADYLGWTRTAANWDATKQARIDACIKSGLRQVYYPRSVAQGGKVHQWSWMRPVTRITTVAPYSTGTVGIANGIVTLAGGTWPTWAATDGELIVRGVTYQISVRTSGVLLTLTDLTVNVSAGTKYVLGHPGYSLPADFGGQFDGDLCYEPGISVLWPPIQFVSDAVIRRKRQNDVLSDRPLYAAIRPKTFDPVTGQRWSLVFYPTPDAAYTLYGRYKVAPTMLDTTNAYPLGGPELSELFLESCLAIAEQRLNEASGDKSHSSKFIELLMGAVSNDADSFSPEYLGYNRDRSDERNRLNEVDQHAGVAIHSYNGTYYYD